MHLLGMILVAATTTIPALAVLEYKFPGKYGKESIALGVSLCAFAWLVAIWRGWFA